MTRTRALLLGLLSLLPGVLSGVLPGGPAAGARADAPTGVVRYHFLRAQVLTAPGLGTVAVGMPDPRTVRVQRQDPVTGRWSRPITLFRGRGGVTCGEIHGRTSPGGVALVLACDRPYYEDQAPVHSQALVSTDLVHWARHRLRGEAYSTPAIAPSGRYAAWQAGGRGGYVEWSATAGFLAPADTTYDSDAGGTTLVVDDAGTVDQLGPEFGPDGSCRFGVHARTLAGVRSDQVVTGAQPGCTDTDVDGVDALTAVGHGYSGDRASTYVVSRTEPDSPWLLTRIAPDQAPGLVSVDGDPRRVVATVFPDTAGQPLVALSSADRQHVTVQVYDETAQTWGPQRQVYDAGRPRCRDAGSYQTHPWPVFAVALRCGAGVTLIAGATPDTLAPVRVGRRTWTIGTAGVLAAPTSSGTTLVSPQGGTTTVPVTAGERCDVVYAVGPTSLVRVHARAGEAWPTRLQRSDDGAAWRSVRRLRMPDHGRCTRAQSVTPHEPSRIVLRGTGHTVRVLKPADYDRSAARADS